MFKAAVNPYDDIVAKATDENQTSEDWGLLATVWDKVNDDGATGARNCVLAIQKRLQHRNANVQLYALTLADSLINNCKIELHREISSRAFTQTLTRLVQDRTTHDKVKRRTMQLLKQWSETFKKDESLGIVEETFETLRKTYRFEDATTTAPAPVPHTALKQEEEDMQRAIAESEAMARQQQQQQQQQQYARPSQASTSYASAPQASTSYAPAPAPAAGALAFFSQADGKNLPDVQHVPVQENATPKRPQAPSRVKALYDFEPQEDGELAFRKGDIIRVVNSAYEGWWKGELDGRIGIFPLTYIEIIPDPTPESIARDAEVEAQVFAQAGSVDRLLAMLSAADAQNSNISDDDELMELYQQCILLRPKIVKLLDKYSQKQKDLGQLHDKFKVAKTAYDAMLEESYTRNNPQHQRPAYGSQGSFAPPQQAGYALATSPAPPQAYGGYPQQQPGPPPQSFYPGQPGAPAGSPYPQQQPGVLAGQGYQAAGQQPYSQAPGQPGGPPQQRRASLGQHPPYHQQQQQPPGGPPPQQYNGPQATSAASRPPDGSQPRPHSPPDGQQQQLGYQVPGGYPAGAPSHQHSQGYAPSGPAPPPGGVPVFPAQVPQTQVNGYPQA